MAGARTRRTAHPRACGENAEVDNPASRMCGSSPRVRGKRVDIVESAADFGLIPARAGKTSPCARLSSIVTAHPRACGENPHAEVASILPLGSSPRVRGKLAPHVGAEGHEGLIPARAGKTSPCARLSSIVTAHPRACGENL